MHVVASIKTPNVLPHQKIRDNPHVCAEEWEVLQETFNQNEKSEMQKRFVDAFGSAAMRLFKYMGVSTDCMLKHKLYNLELIKLSHDVSFLIICPPIELSCSLMSGPPGQREMFFQRADLVSVSVCAFEMGQLFAYDNESIRKCARLSLVVDLEMAEANHCQRQAFSTGQAQSAKEHLNRLQEIRADLMDYWKSIRWLVDVMTFARNRCSDTGISMRSILNVGTTQTEVVDGTTGNEQAEHEAVKKLTRQSPCRLSWPNNYRKRPQTVALSKSDQQLNFVMARVNCSQTTDVDVSRRNSADAKCHQHVLQTSEESLNHFVDRYHLCKSDETLSRPSPSSPVLQRKRSKTINARICSKRCADCDTTKSSSSTHINRMNTSEPIECNSATITYNVAEYLTKEDDKAEKMELSSNGTTDADKENVVDVMNDDLSQFGTIQVCIANETDIGNGLHNGICLQLHVTTQTTAREIIDLVLNECNRSWLQTKIESPMCDQQLNSSDFCLFAVFGNRGRSVPDNFRPLQLQNPWIKGRLFVRRTHDILAEIEQSKCDVHDI